MINFKFNLPLLLLVFFTLFFIFGIYYSPKTYLTFEDIRLEVLDPLKENKENTYVIGSSRVRELGNPVLFPKQHSNLVNLGLNGSTFMTNFFIALYLLENKKPKNILFEVTPYAGIYSKPVFNFQLLYVFNATSLNYLDYKIILDDFKRNIGDSSYISYLSRTAYFFDYLQTFNFFRCLKNTDKESMLISFKKNIGHNFYSKDKYESNITAEVFKNIGRFDFNNKNVSERPIEAYFIEYLNEVATKKGIEIKYVVPLTLSIPTKEYEYYPTQLYNLEIKGMHKYDSLFLKSIYRKENFVDSNHFNKKGVELFYKEVFN